VTSSKGKRSKKRKRTDSLSKTDAAKSKESDLAKPPSPLIENYITIGHNSTTRSLERSLKATQDAKGQDCEKEAQASKDEQMRLAVIFLTHSTDYLPYRHLPTLTAMITSSNTSAPPILLVPLPEASEAKLAVALGIPRVGLVSICDNAPGATALLEYVRENVPPVDVPWIREAAEGIWLGTKVLSVEAHADKNG
jgi:ribonuclease P/MRP protein subunit POP3